MAATRDIPWVEKYRPRVVKDIAFQTEVVSALRKAVETGNLPHLLFYGPPGTGKTSAATAVARELFGDRIKDRKLELNASDERGISVVRSKIKDFARGAVGNSRVAEDTAESTSDSVPSAKQLSRGGLPSFKLIILDEADSLTSEAQSALRRTMEAHSKVTRFCLICNYVSRIIDPIASRCAKFRFKPLSEETMQGRLELVARSESVRLTPEATRALLDVSGGDMRKAITMLQSTAQLFGGDVTPEGVLETSGAVPKHATDKLWEAVHTKNFDRIRNAVEVLRANGFAASDVLQRLSDDLLEREELADVQKSKIALKIARAAKALNDGAEERIQLLDIALFASRVVAGWDGVIDADHVRTDV